MRASRQQDQCVSARSLQASLGPDGSALLTVFTPIFLGILRAEVFTVTDDPAWSGPYPDDSIS